jgi:hypothetical protein
MMRGGDDLPPTTFGSSRSVGVDKPTSSLLFSPGLASAATSTIPGGLAGPNSLQPGYEQLLPSAPHVWVTVFGYQKGTESFVKAQLESLTGGEVVQQKGGDGKSNFMHIRFADPRHVQQALTLNGREVLTGIMLGVCECQAPAHAFASDPWPEKPKPERPSSVPVPKQQYPGWMGRYMEWMFNL